MEENITEMTLFLSLGDSPFKDFIEHPLCQSFLYSKFKKVIWFFVIALMMPHFLFSGLHLETHTTTKFSLIALNLETLPLAKSPGRLGK